MKFLLVLVLTFSISSDFASFSFPEDVSISHSDSSIACDDSGVYDSKSDEHKSHNEEDHHCHVGHFHSVVVNNDDHTEIYLTNIEILETFPAVESGIVQSFSADINRPPIS